MPVDNQPAVDQPVAHRKDYGLGAIAGLLIGLLLMPILKAAKPSLYEQLALAIVPIFVVAVPLGLLVAFYISRKIPVIWQLAKFVVIGGLNTLVDIGLLTLLIFIFRSYLNINSTDVLLGGAVVITFYTLYKSISFITANVNSYYWNKYWTFHKTEGKKSTQEFAQFFFVSIVGFIINVTMASYVFKSVHPFGGLNSDQWALIGAATGSITGLAWNFIGYKLWVFKK